MKLSVFQDEMLLFVELVAFVVIDSSRTTTMLQTQKMLTRFVRRALG